MIRIQITTKLNDSYDITCEQIELENTCPQFLKITESKSPILLDLFPINGLKSFIITGSNEI